MNCIDYSEENKLLTISFIYRPYLVNDVKAIRGRVYNPQLKSWTVNLNESNVDSIANFIIKYKFDITNEKILEEEIKNIRLIKLQKSTIQAENLIQSKAEISNFEVEGLKYELRPFQKVGIEYAIRNNNCIIGDDMGLGKTIQTIGIIQYLNKPKTIICCPDTLKYNWLKEINKWINKKAFIVFSDYRVEDNFNCYLNKFHWPIGYIKEYTDGFYKNTEQGWRKIKDEVVNIENQKEVVEEFVNLLDFDIIIMGYNTLSKFYQIFEKMNFDILICDESHYLKNKKSTRTRSVLNLSKNINNKYLLTGTTVVNRPAEIISQLEILGRLNNFGGWWKFVNRYCDAKNAGFGLDLKGAKNLEELHIKLRENCYIRRNKKDVLKELPDKQRTIIEIKIDNEKEYSKAENDIIEYLKNEFIDYKKIQELEEQGKSWNEIQEEYKQNIERKTQAALNAEHLVQINILKNLAIKGKLYAIKEWINDFLETDEKLIVFGIHTAIIKELAEYYKCGKIIGETKIEERQRLVDDFQENSNTKLLFLNVQAGGVGITLTSASSVCFIELGWTPGEHEQAEDRLHRIGQKDSVNCYYFLAKETIDYDIYDLIEEKRKITNAINKGEFVEGQVNMLNELINKLKKK